MRAGTPTVPVWVPAFAGEDDSSLPGCSRGYFRGMMTWVKNAGETPALPVDSGVTEVYERAVLG